jgi:tetratricopeptide (TPR) repeat protein
MTTDAELAALEDQRDHLLASLEDLEREHDAGDVDEHDYQALKDDYTARAAAVLRAIEAGRAPARRATPTRPRSRLLLTGAAVVAFSVLAGVLLAQSVGRRDPGDVATGDINQSITELLNEAGRRSAQGDLTVAISLYEEVLEEQPTNAEAMTYRGWLLTLDGQQEDGLAALLEAATTNPEYPDVHAFLAVVFFRNGLVPEAARELDRLDALDPPAALRDQVADLRTQVDAALALLDEPEPAEP